jgi:5-methylcytosine-specific restriction protein A
MALTDLTHEAVDAAIAEYNSLGGEAFLRKYGYRPARSYFLVDGDGRRYPSKAIAGVAHGYITTSSSPLKSDEFSGPLQRDYGN